MRDNIVFRLVSRSVVNLFLAIILGLISTALLFMVAFFLSGTFNSMSFIRDVGGAFLNMFGGVNSGSVIIISVFSLLYFTMLQWALLGYIGKINQNVQQIAEGKLGMNHQIPVKERSPFGSTAVYVNQLLVRLQTALEEERRAEQAKNELITNVSHDLRTPLTSVVGYLGLIDQDRYRDEVELRHYISIAYDKSQRLNDLINDLFEYTRMRHDNISLKLEALNLTELLKQLLVQYRLALQEAGMEGFLHGSDTQAVAKADTTKLLRVFENLISNGIAYGKDGGRIDVYLTVLDKEVRVDVVNYGEPISASDLPHVFERFYRGDKSRTQWSGGSGLGLAISKSIVEKHGGTIEAFSDSRQTSFRVSLPRI
ncbi:sensor histidine kinase [Paenibacillus sp. CAU 1782]